MADAQARRLRLLTLRDAALDLFFPQKRCLHCGGAQGVEEGLCAACREELARLRLDDAVCAVCGKPLNGRAVCLRCAREAPAYAAARAVYRYDGPARALVRRMKYGGEYDLPVRRLGRDMAQRFTALNRSADAVVCVPASPGALRKRGYNQAELLARRVAALTGLPFVPRPLAKARGARSQVGLDGSARRENARASFGVGPDLARVLGKRVLLIDDVFTTGSTAGVCAHLLLQHGAAQVRVLCAARRVFADGAPSAWDDD